MPRLSDTAIELPGFYRSPGASSAAPAPAPIHPPTPPVIPHYLTISSTMISSLPSISSTLDGAVRQFYRARVSVPTRRVVLPE